MLGAIGNILLSIMHIKYLWLTESLKGQGMGTKIISMLEVEAIDWVLTSIALETYSFQAPEFYQKFGFIEEGKFESYPCFGINKLFYQKNFNCKSEL